MHFKIEMCPTVTRSRAQTSAFWVVRHLKCESGAYAKRRLKDEEYASLQGWPGDETHELQKHLPRAVFRGAMGNGFSYNVISALMFEILEVVLRQTIQNHGSEEAD